jgi:hypothetical protein
MKIIDIASGAANMFCGSCMHDNALAAAMKAAGEDVSLFPLYTCLLCSQIMALTPSGSMLPRADSCIAHMTAPTWLRS